MTDISSFVIELAREGFNIEVAIVSGRITPKEIWETKDQWHSKIEASKEIWEKMDEDMRESVVRCVKDGMERLYDRVDEWVPEGLEILPGNYLEVGLRVFFTEIKKDVEIEQATTTFKVREAARGAKGLLEAITGEVEADRASEE